MQSLVPDWSKGSFFGIKLQHIHDFGWKLRHSVSSSGSYAPSGSQPTPLASLAPPARASLQNLSEADNIGELEALIPEQRPEDKGKVVVVLDIDETLVHCRPTGPSSFFSSVFAGWGTTPADFDVSQHYLVPGTTSTESVIARHSKVTSSLVRNQLRLALEKDGVHCAADMRNMVGLSKWDKLCTIVAKMVQDAPAVDALKAITEDVRPSVVDAAIQYLDEKAHVQTVDQLQLFLAESRAARTSQAALFSNTPPRGGADHVFVPPPAAVLQCLQLALVRSSTPSIRTLIEHVIETVHGARARPLAKPDGRIFARGTHFHVWVRPQLQEFFERLSKLPVEPIVFTASLPEYADALLEMVDTRQLIRHRLYRDAVQLSFNGNAKDLRLLGRPLSRVLLIDNADYALTAQPANGVRVHSYQGRIEEDNELLRVLGLVETICRLDNGSLDVRTEVMKVGDHWASEELNNPYRLCRRLRDQVESRTNQETSACVIS